MHPVDQFVSLIVWICGCVLLYLPVSIFLYMLWGLLATPDWSQVGLVCMVHFIVSLFLFSASW